MSNDELLRNEEVLDLYEKYEATQDALTSLSAENTNDAMSIEHSFFSIDSPGIWLLWILLISVLFILLSMRFTLVRLTRRKYHLPKRKNVAHKEKNSAKYTTGPQTKNRRRHYDQKGKSVIVKVRKVTTKKST